MEWEYGSATIKLTEDRRFRVFYGTEEGKTYGSYEEAIKAVDDREQREERANRVKVNIPILCRHNGKITKHTLTGIHGGHNGYILKPPIERFGTALYLDHPATQPLLNAVEEAEDALWVARERAAKLALTTSYFERQREGLLTAEGLLAWFKAKQTMADKLASASQAPADN